MARYTPEDVNAALQEGLITEEDAQYLLGALEPTGIPGAVGATLGAVAGGAAGAKYGGEALGKAGKAGEAMRGAKNPLGGLMKKGGSDGPIPKGGTKGPQLNADGSIPGAPEAPGGMRMPSQDAVAGGLGALGAGAAGGLAGSAMDNPEGVQGNAVIDHANKQVTADRDMALRMLMDPNIPPAKKRQILAQLQSLDEQMPPAEAGYGERGGGAMTGLLAGAGALGGAALGGAAGKRLGESIPMMRPDRVAGAGMAAGAVPGTLAGAESGDMMFGKKSPYEEPF